ncbi:MAG TPA: multicopper oxidase family protein [Candidatus Udaeobacter sp.]|nr:multicopper oxidase family protein [Candidatus Udaeobacter sp.]
MKEVPLKVLGKEVSAIAIEQADGTQGYSPQKTDGFHVEVVNQLKVPTSIHWHGLVLPNLMDGVAFVTQNPIPPGKSFRYDFPLKQSGTYWMHSHYGLQEQLYNSAPLIIWTPEERAKADQQIVVMVSDFSFKPPDQILKGLKTGMQSTAATGSASKKKMDTSMSGKMSGNMGASAPTDVIAQKWDDQKQMLVRTIVRAREAEIDVNYDALLANRRTLEDPEIISVRPGESVLLRLIAASSNQNFYVDTGNLEAEILAADGKAVSPIKGSFFQLGVAQRLDLRVTIPKEGGAYPILAQGEGTKLLCGVVLATKGASVSKLSRTAPASTAALDNTQEKKLRALNPLSDRPIDRTLQAALGGNMANYVWTINGAAYPNRKSLDIKKGQRVGIAFSISTNMGHPMHLHGHDFQVVEIDGEKLSGALRDTLFVPPGSKMTVAFDAENAGIWPLHCHLLYHADTGMFTVVKYDGADTKFWQPEAQAKAFTPLN